MTDTTHMSDMNTTGNTQEGQDFLAQGTELIEGAGKSAGAFFTQAQEAVSSAFGSTVEAVKERPVAAAAIAAGAAAAVAFGTSKMRGSAANANGSGKKKKA